MHFQEELDLSDTGARSKSSPPRGGENDQKNFLLLLHYKNYTLQNTVDLLQGKVRCTFKRSWISLIPVRVQRGRRHKEERMIKRTSC